MSLKPKANSRIGPWTGRRRALLVGAGVPLVLSILVHAGLGSFMRVYEWLEKPRQVTDAPGETLLTLVEPPAIPPEVSPEPPTPLPAPEPLPLPSEPAVIANDLAPEQPAPTPAPIPATPAPYPVAAPEPQRPLVESPKAAVFAGVKGDRADRVVYVVDASGPMASSLAFVLEELSRSIDRLEPVQSFQVVLFRQLPEAQGTSAGCELFSSSSAGRTGLVPANRRNKDAVRTWLRSVPAGGKSVPLSGLRAALELQPDLVFLLTRSISRNGPGASAESEWGTGRAEVLKTLDTLNPQSASGRRPTVIKTIQFIDDDPSGLLKAIASIHGDGPGAYSILKLDDLRQR